MKTKLYAQILDRAAANKVPDTTDLTPRILARIAAERSIPMQPKMRLATVLLLVFLTLVLISTVAYAVYRLVGDPGLQSVRDAGLITDIDVTAQPTVLPTFTPERTPPLAGDLENAQTLQGVTLALDWVYLDETRLALGMNFTDLPDGAMIGAPVITFKGVTPQGTQTFSQSVRGDENRSIYVSYQVIHADVIGGKVDITLDVPLVRQEGQGQTTTLVTFHFDLADVPVYAGQWLPIEQNYAVKRSDVQVRMKSVRVLPTTTEVVACYDYPSTSTWMIQNATVQIGSGPEMSADSSQDLSEITDDHCVRLGFATGDPGSEKMLVFRVRALAEKTSATGEALKQITGPWEFYTDIPAEEIVPGQAPVPTATPAALGEETIEDVSVTLDWVFADVKRVALGYTITGLPDVPNAPYLAGFLQVKDAQGNSLTSMGGDSTVEHVPGQPGTLTGTWSSTMADPLQPGETTLSIDLTLDGSAGSDWNNVLAFITQHEDAPILEPGNVPPALPDRLVGTFHFDALTTIHPGQVLEPNQTVEANGITMRLERAEITPSYANFTLCYNKPSAADWGVGAAPVLKAGDYEAQIRGYNLLTDSDYGGYVGDPAKADSAPEQRAGERCIKIEFMLGHSGPSRSLVLTIPLLEQSMPEAIPDAELKAAQEKLKAQGIEVDYALTTGAGGGGGGGPVFTKLPEGMDNQQAFQHLMEALGYLHPGPWVFEIAVP